VIGAGVIGYGYWGPNLRAISRRRAAASSSPPVTRTAGETRDWPGALAGTAIRAFGAPRGQPVLGRTRPARSGLNVGQ
jgi:hypothetical protein